LNHARITGDITYFYVGNFLENICNPTTWYLFVDKQLYILFPFILLLLVAIFYHYRYVGLMVMSLVLIGATTGLGIQAGVNDYNANLIILLFIFHIISLHIYTANLTRVNTYLVGMPLGYIFYKKYWITDLSINKLLIYIVLRGVIYVFFELPILKVFSVFKTLWDGRSSEVAILQILNNCI